MGNTSAIQDELFPRPRCDDTGPELESVVPIAVTGKALDERGVIVIWLREAHQQRQRYRT